MTEKLGHTLLIALIVHSGFAVVPLAVLTTPQEQQSPQVALRYALPAVSVRDRSI